MTWQKCLILACLLTFALPAAATAEWSLNPFATKKTPPKTVGSNNDSGWGWWPGNQKQASPSLWPIRPKGNPSLWPQQSSGQSTWNKMTQGTKNAMAKTADFLNPFDDANDNQGYNPTGSRGITNSQQKSSGGSWLWPFSEPEPEKPQTVSEWMKQPRPGFHDN